MKRLLMTLMLVLLGSVGVRTQEPSPYMTGGFLNGLSWKQMGVARLYYVIASMDGYQQGAFLVLYSSQGRACKLGDAALPFWFDLSPQAQDIVKTIDSFYQDGANISIPVHDAFVWSEMKFAGATKDQLDAYRAVSLKYASQ
jgi:hypothetical protein